MVEQGRLRVVQWATGNVGMRSLRALIEHPAMDLVGCYVHSAAKAGRDVGELTGGAPVGVIATSDVDAILALQPDCILYMPFDNDYDEIVRILAAGINIVTTKGDFQNPECIEPELRAKLEAACAAGGSSIHSTGSSPGFITDTLPIALTQLCRRLDRMTVDEFADCSSRDSPEIIFGAMGFGKSAGEANMAGIAEGMRRSRRRSFHLLGAAMGLPIEEVVATAEMGLATRRTEIAAGVIEAGHVAGTRITISGLRGGAPLLTFRANWYATRELDVDWEPLMHSGWRIQVAGDTPLDMTIGFPVALEDYPAFSPGLTAHPAVNAVTYVVAGKPGILTSLDLPPTLARFG